MWLRSGAGVARRGKRPCFELHAGRNFPELGIRIVGDLAGRLVGQQQLSHHLARGLGAVSCGLDLHAGRRAADAACRQHPLTLDLDHADPAIAVGPVAGFRRIAQMRQLDAEPERGVEDGLAGADVDFAVVDQEGVGLLRVHVIHQLSLSVTQFLLQSPFSQRLGQFFGKVF